MSASCVHLCFNFLSCEVTKNTRGVSRRLVVNFWFSPFVQVLAFSPARLFHVPAMYTRLFYAAAFWQTRVLDFTLFSRFILANSCSRIFHVLADYSHPARESTRERGYELRRVSHHSFRCFCELSGGGGGGERSSGVH